LDAEVEVGTGDAAGVSAGGDFATRREFLALSKKNRFFFAGWSRHYAFPRNMFVDLLTLLAGCVPIFMLKEPGGFRLAVAVGLFLAGACWGLCSVYTRLWNRQYRITLAHHLFCAFASGVTLITTVLFASLPYTKDAALLSIGAWQLQLNTDSGWGSRTFATTYERVHSLGAEDFSSAPPPAEGGAFIPTTTPEARETMAATYVDEACRHFATKRPFLSKIVWSKPGVPREVLLQDVVQWFESNSVYPVARAIEIAATQIRNGLEPQVPRVVTLSRTALVLLFLFAQAIPFAWIGWAAYRDIRAHM